jgi:hypothetical protein
VAFECSGQDRGGLGAQGFQVNSEESSRREGAQVKAEDSGREDARGKALEGLRRVWTLGARPRRPWVASELGSTSRRPRGARGYSEEASECEAASW